MSTFLILLAAGAESAEKGGLPQLDLATWPSQIFWLVVSFFGLYLAMSVIFLPRLGAIIEERRNRIADDLDQASELKRQAEDAEKAYQKALADARAKANAITADMRSELDQQINAEQAVTDAKLAEKIADAEKKIKAMQQSAAAKVTEAAEETTAALVELLIDEKPTNDTVQAAITKVAG